MDYYINRKTNLFTSAIGLAALVSVATFKARDTVVLDVWICDGATPVDLAEGFSMVFAIKQTVAASAPLLAGAGDWTRIDTGHYRSALHLNTEELNAALGDLGSIAAVGELTWSEDGGENWQSTNTLKVTIINDVYKGVEGTPLASPTPDAWLAARLPGPLALTAPPVNGDFRTSSLNLVFPGLNNNMRFQQLDNGDRIFVEFVVPSGPSIPPPFAVWNPVTRRLTVLIGAETSAELLVATIESATTTAFSVATVEGDGSGFVSAVPLTGFTGGVAGTVAAVQGQQAVVTTTNGSGTFKDVWTCSQRGPAIWNPPGDIYRDRTSGILYRMFYKAGAPDTELAYP